MSHSFSLSPTDLRDLSGLLMVAIGVAGELLLAFDFTKKLLRLPFNPTGFSILESKKKWCEIISAALIVIGLGLEVSAWPQHIKEIEGLKHSNLMLQTNVNETRLQLAAANIKLAEVRNAIPARQIPEKQRELFISTLLQSNNVSPKIDIKVFVQDKNDPEAQSFADLIRGMLNDAGYGTNGEQVVKIPPFSVSASNGENNVRLPQIFAMYATDSNGNIIPMTMQGMGSIEPFYPTKATVEVEVGNPKIPVMMRYTTDPNDILYGISDILGYIGFRPVPLNAPGLLKPGEVAFYIPPQVQ